MDEALDSADELALLAALQRPCLALRGLRADHGPWYLEELLIERQQKALVHTHTHTHTHTLTHSVNYASSCAVFIKSLLPDETRVICDL